MRQPRYILSDSQDIPLAYAMLLTPPSAEVWQLQVLDGGLSAVLDSQQLRLVSMDRTTPMVTGRVLRSRGDVLWLERGQSLDEEIRQNLRVSARFKTYLYPVSGSWKGRLAVTAQDLSCGGIAFFSDGALAPGEIVELVIPITFQPLLVQARMLRPRPSTSSIQLWSAKFIDLVEEQERLIRETVFGLQILNRDDAPQPIVFP